jgi:Lrp/AsnC family transcriptional regulator
VAPRRDKPPTVKAQRAGLPKDLDKLDLAILAHLQKDASLTTKALAKRTGTSQPPCWRHRERLRGQGYIKSTVVIADRRKLGFGWLIFVHLTLPRLSEEASAELLRRIDRVPGILECHTVLGEMGLMLKVIAPSLESYQRLLLGEISRLPGVQAIRSTVTLLEIKSTTAIPLKSYRAP